MIKLIVTDMDGTFLNSKNDYNRKRFLSLYQQMKNKGIRFAIASGNQYYQLKSFFEDIQDELTYVAENGAWIIDRGREIYSASLPKDHVKLVLKYLEHFTDIQLVVCGKKNAYILKGNPKFYDETHIYYPRLVEVDSFDGIERKDHILKLNFFCPPKKTKTYCQLIQENVGNMVTAISSGHGCVDLIIPGFHKGHALNYLCYFFHISLDECLCFGDGGNDIEMLKLAKYSYAMENASSNVKKAAKYIAGHHDHDAVNDVIEYYLNQGE